jgi:hypothetical protein
MRAGGSTAMDRVDTIVVIEVRQAAPLISPAYDDGTTTEAELIERYRGYFTALHPPR